MNYRQCVLRRKTATGHEQSTSWIPEPYCVVNKVLQLKNDMGEWTNGWVVMETSDPKPEEWVHAHERDYKKNRKASDI
jgi:hypothetical protein